MPKNILVVDDEEEYRLLLSRTLEGAGYSVRAAATGEEALAFFSTLAPDLVLLDVMLPDMTGFELCQRVRASEGRGRAEPGRASATPILFCTVRSAVSSLARGLKSGGTDYVIKPILPEELLERVRAALREAPAP